MERIGGNKSIPLDVRIVTATNQNLEELIEQQKFRQDLYYRLNVIEIRIKPLRERKEDIPILTHFFVKKFSGEDLAVRQEVLDILNAYERIRSYYLNIAETLAGGKQADHAETD